MKIHKGQLGQALLEVLAMGLAFMSLLGGTFFTLLLIWSTAWTRHHLYEALICLNSLNSKHQCEQHFYNQVSRGLIGFQATGLKWNRTFNHVEVELLSALNTTHPVKKHLSREGL